ncbi:hypothetical protein BLL52_0124 [Rhodoferax antarcticus ANT.BR]|uniref:Uncharacterized protein n=1 Tax=Rhodoferax antarcticus ANT.BR TaxID=1111071 RepID=A0A1Q8YKP3_9BURK|nr:hypothetical protein BLL52_0124 [Rhodoferax antarcticus ANT.BR]
MASELLGNKSASLYDGALHGWTLAKRQLAGAAPLQSAGSCRLEHLTEPIKAAYLR